MTDPSDGLAERWAAALVGTNLAPQASDATLRRLTRLVQWFTGLTDDVELAAKTGASIAGALIDTHYTQPSALAATITVLDASFAPEVGPEARTALRAGLASGFADALRERTRDEQESIRRAVLNSYRTGEARFRTVFRDAPIG